MTLVNQIKARRIARGWSPERLGLRAGIGGSTIRMAELGRTKGYTSDTGERLAAALGESNPQQQNVVIDANLLSGGTFTLYCPRQGTSDTRVTNNRFGPHEFGYSDACTGSHVSAWSGNVVDATGASLGAV